MTTTQTEGLIVGASGNLGRLIADELIARGAKLRVLVRPDSRGKDTVKALEAAGATIVEGDLTSPDDVLVAACRGAAFVISAVQGGGDVIIEGQLRLLRAAKAAGTVRRFIPSDYSYNYFETQEGNNPNSDVRRAFAKAAQAELGAGGSLQVVHVLNGCFNDRGVLFGFLGAIDLEAGVLRLWGDGNTPIDFTTYADTARYTAEAALDPGQVPSRFGIAGDQLTPRELLAAYNETTKSGRVLRIESLGTLADLDAEIERRVHTDPSNFFAYLPLMYYRDMLNGRGKIREVHNGRYPKIRPTTVRGYIAEQGL